MSSYTLEIWNDILKNYWSIVDLQHHISFRCTAKSVSHMYAYIHFFSHIGYYKILSKFSCAIQYVLINHLFYTVMCICDFYPSNSSLLTMVAPMVTIRLVLKSMSLYVFYKSVILYKVTLSFKEITQLRLVDLGLEPKVSGYKFYDSRSYI